MIAAGKRSGRLSLLLPLNHDPAAHASVIGYHSRINDSRPSSLRRKLEIQ